MRQAEGPPSIAHRRQMSDISRWHALPASPKSKFRRQRSSTLEGMTMLSATGKRKPIEMSSELKADKLQAGAPLAHALE